MPEGAFYGQEGSGMRAGTMPTPTSNPNQAIFGLSSTRPGFALSPVDNEEIEIATAVHFTELEGVTYYFSCPNCKRRFLKNPSAYLEPQKVVSS